MDNPNRCGTCKHWKLLHDGDKRGDCQKIEGVDLDCTENTQSPAIVDCSGHEFFSCLSTLADFGCVLWEPK
jgi:hypothetical protein